MSQFVEMVVKLAVSLVALAMLGVLLSPRFASLQKHRRTLLVALTALGVAAHFNFGGFHTDGTLLHQWDQLHYVIGSKYFPELGYDGLYVAIQQAREENGEPHVPAQTRDLRSLRVVETSTLSAHRAEVRARFDDARWQAFKRDATAVWAGDDIFLDHGYLPTPAHTAVSRLASAWLPFGYRWMYLFASLDLLLLALTGWLLVRWTSLEIVAACSLMFGLGFATRYFWLGGAFLRHDWLAALLIAAAALHTRRFGLAGLLLGYAAIVRLFPALFALPLLVWFVSERRRGQLTRTEPSRFCAGFVTSVLVLFAAGAMQGRGVAAWTESFTRLQYVARATIPNAIGLRVPFVTSRANFMGELVQGKSLYLLDNITEDYAALAAQRHLLIVLATLAVIALACWAAWRARSPEVAFACGTVVVFAATASRCYYGGYFLPLAFREPLRTAFVFIVTQTLTFLVTALVLYLDSVGELVLNGAAVFMPASVLLGVVLVSWLSRSLRA